MPVKIMIGRIITSVPLALAAGFALRLAGIAFVDFSKFNWSLPQPDLLMEYGVIARNLAEGSGFSYTWYNFASTPLTLPSAFMPPGLVMVEYVFIAVFGYSVAAVTAIFLMNVLAGGACIWVTGKITSKLFRSEFTAGVARWMVALYPPFIYASTSFGITSSILFLNSLLILYYIKLSDTMTEGKSAANTVLLLGVISGTLILFRGEGFLYILVMLIVLIVQFRKKWQYVIKPALLISMVAILMMTPWTIRNWMVFGRFIPVSSNGSFNFWRGNNELSNGSPLNESGTPLWTTTEIAKEISSDMQRGAQVETASSDRYFNAAIRWIADHPFDALGLAAKKGLIFWTFDSRNNVGGWWYFALHSIALMTVIVGVIEFLKQRTRQRILNRNNLTLLGAWTLLSMLIAMVFLPLARFQVITISLLVPIAALGVGKILERALFTKYQHFHFTTLIKES